MTSAQFEILTSRLIAKKLRKQLNRRIEVDHQRNFTSLTGNTYNVDVSFAFEILGITYVTIVECKYWNTRVSRDRVCTLKAIVEDLHAHMGIVVSRKGFQKGAIQYAKSHNIALIKIDQNNKLEIVVFIPIQFNEIRCVLNCILSDNITMFINPNFLGEICLN